METTCPECGHDLSSFVRTGEELRYCPGCSRRLAGDFPSCTKCGRLVCTEHAVMLDAGVVCEACHLGFESAVAPGQMAQRLTGYTATDALAFTAGEMDDNLFGDLS